MPTPAEIRAAVDTRLSNLWSTIQTKQNNYASSHGGRYWQGLRTHVVFPADGLTVLPTVGAMCPTDQPGSPWPNAILTLPIEMAIQIDCYSGPNGNGYQATVWVTIYSDTWSRTAQVGPETWRVRGWHRDVENSDTIL